MKHTAEELTAPYASASSIRGRQAARIIKHLRQNLAHEYPLLNMPTGWMIDCLVGNCPPSVMSGPSTARDSIGSGPEWLPMIANILNYLAEQTSSNTPSPPDFYQLDSQTPLFPNHEVFDDYDVYRFSTALLQHIKALA